MNATNITLGRLRTERALSVLFHPKEILIINKLMNLEQLTKIENERYSRVIKPKLNAVIDLYELAIVTRSKGFEA
jgi:hypothetical protein